MVGMSCELLECVAAFKALNRVVESCFGKKLSPNYERHIFEFRHAFLALGVSVTPKPKTHILFRHITDFLKHVGSSGDGPVAGLGVFSEQAFESVHHDFAQTLQHYSVSSSNDKFGQKLLRAVCHYNSQRISRV